MKGQRRSTVRMVRDGLTVVGAIVAAFYWLQLTRDVGDPADAHAYYVVPLGDLYGRWALSGSDAYQYAPVFAQVMAVLRIVPFEAFVALWRAAALACVVWLAGPMTLPVLLWGPAASEVNAGNINIFLAVAIAAGFRYPGTWASVLLTKVTPGVGLLWFAVRREWHALRTVAFVTAAIVAISFAISPGQWIAWVQLLVGHAGESHPTFPFWIPFSVRFPLAVAIALVGARFGWRATVAIAATIAAPMLYFPTQAMALGALPPLREAAGRAYSRWLERRAASREARSGEVLPA